MPVSADDSLAATPVSDQPGAVHQHRPVLLIFTRTLEEGKCKTRLIPVWGPAGALLIHRRLIERTFRTVREFQEQTACPVQVHYAGSQPEELARLMDGAGVQGTLRPQSTGDLGDRLQSAFQQASREGYTPLLVIGSDCPTLTAADLQGALQVLKGRDVVLGPACDGGYYLLGMQEAWRSPLIDIPWGSAEVLTATRTRLAESLLTWGELAPRADVDLPEDLTPAVRRMLHLKDPGSLD